jgi:hypothetical protein
MKDIMQKLAELEATAPKVTKKRMLREDSTTPPMKVANKPASLKDVFENMAMQKPIPVVGKQGDTQSTGAGFLNINDTSPAGQAMQKALTDLAAQGKAQIVVPTQPGQQPQATAAGKPNPNQMQTGQQAMQEESSASSPKEELAKEIFKIDDRINQIYNHGAGNSPEPLERKLEGLQAQWNQQFSGEDPMKLGKALWQQYHADQKAAKTAAATPAQPQQKSFMGRMADKAKQVVGMKEEQLDELSPQLLARAGDKANAQRKDLVKIAKAERGLETHHLRAAAPDYPVAKAAVKKYDQEMKFNDGVRAAERRDAFKADMAELLAARGELSPEMKRKLGMSEGAKVDRMVKHIEKSEKKSGKSKDKASDIAWATANKRGMLDNKNKKKVKEGDLPSSAGVDTKGAGLGAGRSPTTLEGKTMNKKAKPDFLDIDKDGNKKEPMKKAAADKKKAPVKEGMNGRIAAARHEGRADGLRGAANRIKHYDDLEEARAYHAGYKDGLDECYGQGVYETAPAMPAATVPGMASAAMPAMEAEFDEGNAFTAALAKTPKGGKFSVGGKTFTDRTGYDAKVNEYAFESWDNQLNDLLNEGLSVSISKGQENSPDSVTITAQDAEAEHLLAFVKNAGLGLFGDDNADTHSSAMSVQPSHGAPDEVGAGGIDIGVVDGHDGMMGLMQKLSGIQSDGAADYADEEGDEEQLYGNHETADKKDCGCDGDCECSDYDKPSNEGTCNECGTYEGVHEAGCSMGRGKEMVDEVETEDQMEFEVSEANAPDSGAANATNDMQGNAAANASLAKADAGQDIEDGMSDQAVQESDDEEEDEEETVAESFANLFRKLSFIAEESTEKEDDKAEKAGKKVAKDIEHDEDHKGKDDDKAEKAGKKVTKDIEYDDKKDKKEKVDEWANNAGPGKTVSDTTFEQDIDFMTKVIAGGLNKPKSTGQTTVPVIAGQNDRMIDSPKDWATLAGIKK